MFYIELGGKWVKKNNNVYLHFHCILYPQVSTAGTSLLGSPSALPLGFGMLGGLVPVSLPFQFPPLLNFSPPGAPGAAGIGSAPSSNSGYPLAQSDLMGEWAHTQLNGSSGELILFLALLFLNVGDIL